MFLALTVAVLHFILNNRLIQEESVEIACRDIKTFWRSGTTS